MATFVLTAIGDDQAGLVEALSGVVAAHGGSWDRSQMASLAGKFAGIVEVSVPERHGEGFVADLRPLAAKGLLDVQVERASEHAGAVDEDERYALEFVGTDQPGIVHEISAALAAREISFVELTTGVEAAPMSGGLLFRATAVLTSPAAMDLDDTRTALEQVADELRLELDLQRISD